MSLFLLYLSHLTKTNRRKIYDEYANYIRDSMYIRKKKKENAKKVLNIIYGWLENVDYINVHKDESLTTKYTNKD